MPKAVPVAGAVLRQACRVEFRSLILPLPALVQVLAGQKRIGWPAGQVALCPGEAVLLPEGLPLTVENIPAADGPYLARALAFPRSAADRAYQRLEVHAPGGIAALRPGPAASAVMDQLFAAPSWPAPVLALRQEELLVWLALDGACLAAAAPVGAATRLRQLIADDPARQWSAAIAARALAVSEATLRRRLAAEGASFTALLTDVRMSHALALLQTTEALVTAVAGAVGYESPSRFTARFRARFGINPREIRGRNT